MAKDFNFLPNWANFGKFGHTNLDTSESLTILLQRTANERLPLLFKGNFLISD